MLSIHGSFRWQFVVRCSRNPLFSAKYMCVTFFCREIDMAWRAIGCVTDPLSVLLCCVIAVLTECCSIINTNLSFSLCTSCLSAQHNATYTTLFTRANAQMAPVKYTRINYNEMYCVPSFSGEVYVAWEQTEKKFH